MKIQLRRTKNGKRRNYSLFYGKIIGKYQYQSNGDIVVRDFYNRILGYYIVSRDVTTDFYRRVVAKGNAVGMLLKG